MPADRDILDLARQLRRNITPAEKILWKKLRGRRFENFKFRRQHPIGRYIVDFFCRESLLIVELDGDTHWEAKKPTPNGRASWRRAATR